MSGDMPAERRAPPPETPDAWDRAAMWLAKHGALPAVGILVLALCGIYGRVFTGELAGDDLSFHFAESARLADCIRHGDWDFWNPSANGGFASAYYYQVIPQLASAIPTAVFGHHLFWFQLSVFLPLVLAPLAAYRGMRLMGAVPWQAAIAAFVLSFTVGTSRWGYGADGTFSVGLYTQTWALAAFPLALGHIVRWARERKGLAPAIAWGAFVGLCHPFGGVSLAASVGIGAIVGALVDRATWRSPLTAAVVLSVLGFLALAVWAKLAKHRPLYAAFPALLIMTGLGFAAWGVRVRDAEWRHSLRTVLAEPARLLVVGAGLAIATMPGWLTMFVVDTEGFGGFPHRVADEVGPGFTLLSKWFYKGMILDHGRDVRILTILIPIALLIGLPLAIWGKRGSWQRWLWAPALLFAFLLGVGPHLPKTSDDLIAPVRFLGAMQISLALGIGAGAYAIGEWVWSSRQGSLRGEVVRYTLFVLLCSAILFFVTQLARGRMDNLVLGIFYRATFGAIDNMLVLRILAIVPFVVLACFLPRIATLLEEQYAQRTGLAAIAAVCAVFTIVGWETQTNRVRTLDEMAGPEHPTITQPTKTPPYRDEMMQIIDALRTAEPRGRKQVGPGCENHWWNLLSYVYARVPSMLQMGGGGLQASPNYDFLWTVRDFAKNAWVFDAPYLVFEKSKMQNLPVGEVVIETPRYLVRRLPTPGLVTPIEITGVMPGGPVKKDTEPRKAALQWMKTEMPLENRHLAYEGSGPKTAPPQGKTLRAWRQDSPGEQADIVAEIEVTGPTTFVIRESWHPRWRAYVDGVAVPIRRVTPDFPAVDVTTPGKHVIQLRFERPWFVHAAWLAWPGTALLAWLLTVWLPRRRERARLPAARATS
ncbi:MAG: hypothetical protein SFX73_40740 [Kofleriaceae bacterium]|nr:hypothetical protein [Kofleriaceae bacterium]